MKRILFIIPLILLSLFFYSQETTDFFQNSRTELDFRQTNSVLLENKLQPNTNYKLDVRFDPQNKLLIVSERIIWQNTTQYPTNELQFHLYANAFSNNNTELVKKISLDEIEKTKIEIKKLHVNEEEKEFIYIQPEVENPFDSTVIKIELSNSINPGDSVTVSIEYELKIPRSLIRFGYAAGREFYFIAQWFPKLGVFKNGEWTCSQYHPYAEFYSDFADYDVKITLPKDYILGTTGTLISIQENEKSKTYNYIAKNVIDFAWTASPEFLVYENIFQSKYGREINIKFLIQPENEDLIERKFTAVENTLKYLEEYIGEYPFNNITLVDVPRSSKLGGMEYPEIVTYFTPLFTPIELQKPESTIIHEIIHQYFYAAVSSNETYEGWLDEGVTTYLEKVILDEYYGKPILSFSFIDYFPIYGIKFLAFREIPLIYTLRTFEIDHYVSNLSLYYANDGLGNLNEKSFSLPNYRSSITNTYAKPSLTLHSLEKYINRKNVLDILSRYYNKYKFSHVTGSDLINEINGYSGKDLNWFVDSFINKENKFDYSISSIFQVNETSYKILAERLEDGITPTEIAIYTESDTSYIDWDGKDRWKEFIVYSEDEVLAAEVDPHRKNILDINYANNSYIIESKYWASLSIAIRWYFWVQNALQVFGSIG
ncbi:MAG: M1 family metallopeptidase [Melioribacteraceae bacterium]|nr:M1 family metallopeptidase [Melioribacteraceae bacterium]